MNMEYPRLVETFQRDYGYKDNVWTPQAGDGGNDLEVKPWHVNEAGLD